MKVGIFNRYWSTMGGGEQNAGSYAAFFATEHEVELISTEDFDVGQLAKVLGKPEISKLPVRVIGNHATAATEVSSEYDLFISHSYLSDDYSLAHRSLYVCMFPQGVEDISSNRISVKTLGDLGNELISLDRVTIDSKSTIQIKSRENEKITFISRGCAGVIKVFDAKELDFEISRLKTEINPKVHTLSIPKGKTVLKFFPSNTVALTQNVQLDSLRQANGVRVPWGTKNKQTPTNTMSFVRSYDRILSISGYTAKWVEQRWATGSKVHYPAVSLREWDENFPKEKIILSVGRFFSENHGHSKRQLQMVKAFEDLLARGLTDWRLVLVGGCDAQNRDYAMSVKRAARSLPVDIMLNVDHQTLDNQFKRASIYWHATGLGIDIQAFPEKAEHFGIAPVEAMSAGCIPLLIDSGGTAELVEDGVSGFVFRDIIELVDRTESLINADSYQIDGLRRATAERAKMFGSKRFNEELSSLVNELFLED